MSQADYIAKYPRRVKLRDTVETYWIDEPRKPPGSLDASLKKHTTLINRLKASILVGPADALIKEIDGLTLTKYLEEIAGAVVEGVSKGRGDPEAAVDVIAHLHTRLAPDFLGILLPQLLAILSATSGAAASKDAEKDREKEDKERIGRQRVVLRIVAELALVLAWPEGAVKGAGEVGKVIKAFMTNDPTFINIPLIAAFLKYFDRAYLGAGSDDGPLPPDVGELVPAETQKSFKTLLTGYFNSASKTLVKGQVKLLEQDKKNHEAYIKSGEIFEDRQHAYERMTRAVERLTTGVQSLADLLRLPMPDLPTSATLSKGGLQIVETASSFVVRGDEGSAGIWDDDEERRFYEEMPDLRDFVPASLLGVKVPKNGEAEAGPSGAGKDEAGEAEGQDGRMQREVEEDIKRQLEQMSLGNGEADGQATAVTQEEVAEVDDKPEKEDTAAPTETTEDDALQSGPAARLTALFAAMPDAVNREMIDRLAVEFAFLNSKAARKRLIKFIAEVPKNRTDLLPHYARFVAVLDEYMPDVGKGVVDLLEEEMRYLQRKKAVRELDSLRLKNVRFYGELAKFKVARPYAILHVLKVFLDDFKPNIENMSNLLETCGRFLLRNEGTAETAKSMIELMRRKQGLAHLDNRQTVMLENAFYQCNPPERVAREVVELPPMHAFIQHLLRDVLIKRTLDKVLRLLRKLHWEDPEIYTYLLDSFTEAWEIKYGNIQFLAALVHDLQRYHPEFSVAVVDQVMEDIRIGMEENIFKHNQRRIASVRYLGELYMYRVVNASVVFETLWSLLSFGHGEGLPVPGRDSPIDAVDDFFRVRLVCTLLDACGMCFDRGSQKRKLDHFLVVLQLYVACKRETPMDVEFMLGDTLDALRPKTPHLHTFAEAAAAVDVLLAERSAMGDVDVDDADSESDGEGGRGGADDEEDDEDAGPDAHEANIDSDGPEDDVVVLRDKKPAQPDEGDQDARVDFDREFAKMLADTTDARRGERKGAAPIFDMAVPLIKRERGVEAAAAAGTGTSTSTAVGHARKGSRAGVTPAEAPGGAMDQAAGAEAGAGGGMQFSLLSKRGNKQQIRDIAIPLDSAIAVNSRTYQERNKAEQEQLKRLVLQNERRQGQSELLQIQDDMNRRGIRMRFAGS